jgi:hypothetical protein
VHLLAPMSSEAVKSGYFEASSAPGVPLTMSTPSDISRCACLGAVPPTSSAARIAGDVRCLRWKTAKRCSADHLAAWHCSCAQQGQHALCCAAGLLPPTARAQCNAAAGPREAVRVLCAHLAMFTMLSCVCAARSREGSRMIAVGVRMPVLAAAASTCSSVAAAATQIRLRDA